MRTKPYHMGRHINFYFIQVLLLLTAASLHSQNLDISGWKVVQANSTITLTFPLGTSIAPGGYVVIGRNASQAQFEAFWGVTLAANVKYINGFAVVGSNGFPVINGSENYELQNASSNPVDGPTISQQVSANQSIQRRNPSYPAGQDTSWTKGAPSTATPGSGAGPTANVGLVINEFSDATTYSYEFVELYYDVTPPPTGIGSATAGPSMLAGSMPDTVYINVKSNATDTLGYVDVVVPSIWSWSHSTSDIVTTGGGTPTVAVSADTIQLSGAAVTSADSVQVRILNITPPDSTDLFPFKVLTGTAADSILPLLSSPNILVHGLPRAIADVKTNDANGVPLLLGRYVTIRGIVTVSSQFGGPGYLQDNSAGIAVYDSSVTNHVSIGDEIVLLGTISPFNGLCELGSATLLETVGTGNTVDPLLVTVTQLKNDGAGGVENYEGLLVRVNTASVRDTFNNPIPNWTVGGSGTNYRLIDATAYMDIRVDNNVDYANTPAPQSAFDVIGVVSQFKSASPYIGGYQLMPRFHADILATGPLFATLPVESNLTPSSFTVSWRTVNNGSTGLRYGTTAAYELGTLTPPVSDSLNHSVDVSGLQAATIYHVLAFSAKGTDTSFASDLAVSTTSPPASTGQINVYFNKSVNTSVSAGENALGNQDLVNRLLTRIDHAQRSIDCALYSLSGSSQGDVIAGHLVSARNRGVKVRVICEHDNRNYSGFQNLIANGIALIDDAYDPVWAGAGLMHNKFFVIDYRGGAPESVWVWSGSWNPTYEGTALDRQNSIEIQDVALAGAYTTEFNLMWGSSTDTPNQSASRFGARKPDLVPHNFIINNTPVSVYFSPSDHTTSHIGSTLGKAQHSIANAILTFTRKDLADTLIGRKNGGSKVRVVIDNNTDQGNQYSYLQANAIDIHLKGGSGLLHHKYAVVDADQGTGDQYLITGSHNWSNAAENSNDENTLIIKSSRLPNLYLQEFAARYYEAGGTDSIHVILEPQYAASPSALNFDTVDVATSRQDSFSVSNAGSAALSITGAVPTDGRFGVAPSVASIGVGGSQTFTVTFSPDAVGPISGFIVLTHNAAGSPDSIALHGVGRQIDTTSTTTLAIGHAQGWNMIAVPLEVLDPRKTVLYPSAVSQAFAYEGTYVPKDTLIPGIGYWLKFGAAMADSLTGRAVLRDTLNIGTSWSMIGGITSPVAVRGIIQSPPGNIVSPFFGYSGGYQEIDTLRPGQSCWVKAAAAGSLILTGAAIVPKTAPQQTLKSLNTITFTDGEGHRQSLYFGSDQPVQGSRISYELPPVPPAEAFDVRFGSGKMAETFPQGLQKAATFPIRMQVSEPTVSVRWTVDTHDANSYTLDDGSSVPLRLTGSGAASLQVGSRGLSLTLSPGKELPKVIALGQNYPNPFNPVTTIPIALPQRANVTLTIVNTLGAVVSRPLDHQDVGEGYHNIVVDGSGLASGVYYYRLDVAAGADRPAFSQVKKFLLVK